MKVSAADLFMKEHHTERKDVQIEKLKKNVQRLSVIISHQRDRKRTQQYTTDLTNSTRHRVKSQGSSGRREAPERSRPFHPDMNFKKGKTTGLRFFLSCPQRRSWRSEPASQGTPVTMMQEPCALAGTWYQEYAETQGWTEAMCIAQHYWVRPESRTDIPSAFRCVSTLQNQLDMFLSQ